jgi:enoyl-CoA hydratase
MKYKNLLVTVKQKIALVTINRPKKLNALNKQTLTELHWAFAALQDDDAVRVIVLTGSGEKAFVAGADISEFHTFDSQQGYDLAKEGQELVFDFLEQSKKPVIAAINGYALGGGLELAMSCHIRVASDHAKMGLPETTLGLIPGYGGTQRLPQLVGKGIAYEMILTAGMIDANRALEVGLVNHVTSSDQLLNLSFSIAEKVIKNSPNAISKAIAAVRAGFSQGVDGYKVEMEAFSSCFDSDDFITGTKAFLSKKTPKF